MCKNLPRCWGARVSLTVTSVGPAQWSADQAQKEGPKEGSCVIEVSGINAWAGSLNSYCDRYRRILSLKQKNFHYDKAVFPHASHFSSNFCMLKQQSGQQSSQDDLGGGKLLVQTGTLQTVWFQRPRWDSQKQGQQSHELRQEWWSTFWASRCCWRWSSWICRLEGELSTWRFPRRS